MKKYFNNILLLAVLFALSKFSDSAAAESGIEKTALAFMREKFYAAVENEVELEKLENYVNKNFPGDYKKYPPIVIAYKGGIEALKGKHAFWPLSKYTHLVSALDILEEAIGLAPHDLEIRFMRFSIVSNLPGILGYGEELESDRDELVNLLVKKDYTELDESIQKGIIQFVIDSEELTPSQMKLFSEKFDLAQLNE